MNEFKTAIVICSLAVFISGTACDKDDDQTSIPNDDPTLIPYDEFWLKSDYEKAVKEDTPLKRYLVFEENRIGGFNGCKEFNYTPIEFTGESISWKVETRNIAEEQPIEENCDVGSYGENIEPDQSWIGYEIVDTTLTIFRQDLSPLILIRDEGCTVQDPCVD